MAEVEVGMADTIRPRRPAAQLSLRFHRRFSTVEEYVSVLGGSQPRVIEKVLIANNGVAAVKAIRSIRRWAYEVFGNDRAISFVVMATPEDLRANAEYIRMADVIVDVPGGSNNHNYANVTLIVELARLHGVHAVWAGWGHASENPTLPNTLAESNPPIKFIGPAGPPMQALGDKIGSTIIAQSAGVPCIGWNGAHVKAEYDKETGTLPSEAFEAASIPNATAAEKAAAEVGFPVMIKASEGGGGKGIRRVDRQEDVANAYRQVCGEVPGSPIFIMKLSSNSRHLEVQLLADEYGDAVALNGRDCSVQRRHQKIIEEGPPVAADPVVWKEMEKAAIALAKAVHYTNAGTVEYLYSESESKFYFLELNPRLQVEHPVTEMITKVNLPAAQLQVAMGIPLCNIPEIRELYGRNRFEEDPTLAESKIDFKSAQRVEPNGHCIAVRITAENAEAGFKPTSGGIQELNFRSTPSVWGYFSMDSSGSIHEFADSQFGHLFASGPDREQARRNMVLALKELSIRGDISTTVDYISKLIELNDFVANNIDTGWLDGIIQTIDGSGGATEGILQQRKASIKMSSLHDHVNVVMGASVVSYNFFTENEKRFIDLLEKGQLPPRSLLSMTKSVDLILNGVKYKLDCTRRGPGTISMCIHGETSKSVLSTIRVLSDGGYLIDSGGSSRVVYLTHKGDAATGMRLNIAGASTSFSPDYDPTSLRTDVAGKLVKKLKADGAKVKKGEPYCEIEVMKMFMPLKVEEAGVLTWCSNEGAAIGAGDLLATLELDNPENVTTATVFVGEMNVPGWGDASEVASGRPHLMFRSAMDTLTAVMSGYVHSTASIDQAMADLTFAVTQPTLAVCEIEEQLSVLSGRIPASVFDPIQDALAEFKSTCTQQSGSEVQLRFPSENVAATLQEYLDSLTDASQKAAFSTLVAPLRDAVTPYTCSKLPGVPGAERALQTFLKMLRTWIIVERWFSEGKSYADAVDNLRKAHKSDPDTVLSVCRAHEQLSSAAEVVSRIIMAIAEATRVDLKSTTASAMGKRMSVVAGASSLPEAMPCISEIGSMSLNDKYTSVALSARKLLMQESMPSLEQRKLKTLSTAKALSSSAQSEVDREVENFLSERIPMVDLFLPLLKECETQADKVSLVELYQRDLYRMYTVKDFQRDETKMMVKFSFLNKPSESAVNTGASLTSMTELSRIVSSGSLNHLSESSLSAGSAPEAAVVNQDKEKISQTTLRTGVTVVLNSVEELDSSTSIATAISSFPAADVTGDSHSVPVNVLYLIVLETEIGHEDQAHDNMATRCQGILSPHIAEMKTMGIRRVSFMFPLKKNDEYEGGVPALFTFRFPEYKEDSLYRQIDPGLSMHLDLNRVAYNFKVRSLGSRHTSTCHVHLYEGTPRLTALLKDKTAKRDPRLFARAFSFVLEFSAASYEHILVDALNAFDLHVAKSKNDNHLFLNLMSDFEKAVLDPVVVEEVVVEVLKRHTDRVSALGISEIETRIVCCLNKGTPPIAIRLFASNPTGYVHVMNTYVEASNDNETECIFKLIGGTKASLASAGDSSWDGKNVNTPYPLTRLFDAQRKAALRSSDTLYCYDLPALFEAAVEQQWLQASHLGSEGTVRRAGRPLMVMYTTELVVHKQGCPITEPWTMKDYLNGDLELIQMNRRAGDNNVGMVAWLVVLKTVEYPNGRQVVLISNDITHKAGSFGTREDVVFKMASEFARESRIPRLFVAANSGARIGLADRVKKCYKVAFKNDANPDSGFDFLYVSKADYDTLTANGMEIRAVETVHNGETVYKITDVIGSEPDLGVENLKGSGLIAGETSAAYDDIFTMTIVLGRTVGIGAYLVRLGQRTIQKTSASPIILTGYQALNKLMGVDVYSTNDQLGGPGIMYPNGISHLVAPDHLQAVKAAVDWLSYVPAARGALLPITDIRGIDDIDRPISFIPKPGVPYDPRLLLAGGEDSNGIWQTGFFDKGSFTETLAGWAKTVVVGRARLGGIPMGVVITENRTAEAIKPADPADVTASEAVIQEAGCVWFPNSAYKTAQAIKDFRTEDLPLIVFANWRGFSGGQRDMFDEVLKYGSLIVDAFVSYQQPVFVFIPPFAEIRGGAWVVLDASINASVMEMYAAKSSARGGVLEANGAASVKYRSKDLLSTMHRLDDKLVLLDKKLQSCQHSEKAAIEEEIKSREQMLLPVYEQVAVQFCELHDTPGRMKAVGVIEKEVEWSESRRFFYYRLRRKLAEFDLRKKLIDAAEVGRGVKSLEPLEATAMIKAWFIESSDAGDWDDDMAFLSWMAKNNQFLERKVLGYTKEVVVQEVVQVMTAGGKTARVGISGIIEGLQQAMQLMSETDRQQVQSSLADILRK